MRLILLGSGNSAGMPLYGCNCQRCQHIRVNKELQRGPACALLEFDNQSYLLDAGLMDIASKFPSGSMNGIFLTHFHPDHVQGLFHLRWGTGCAIAVFCPPDEQGCADLYQYPGILDFQAQTQLLPFTLGTVQVTPLPLAHSKMTFGYLFQNNKGCIAYLTDTKGLPDNTLVTLEQHSIDLLVIDCSFPPQKESSQHNNLTDILEINQKLQPKRIILTHISHDMDIWLAEHNNSLPDSIIPGHDNMIVYPY